jgi:hypothetical protein
MPATNARVRIESPGAKNSPASRRARGLLRPRKATTLARHVHDPRRSRRLGAALNSAEVICFEGTLGGAPSPAAVSRPETLAQVATDRVRLVSECLPGLAPLRWPRKDVIPAACSSAMMGARSAAFAMACAVSALFGARWPKWRPVGMAAVCPSYVNGWQTPAAGEAVDDS